MQWQKELHKANQNLCLQKQNKTKTQNQKQNFQQRGKLLSLYPICEKFLSRMCTGKKGRVRKEWLC